MYVPLILRNTSPALALCRYLNCWTAGITKKHRKMYERTYPTVLVLPDGSSINIDYHEPRQIIVLPVDTSILTEEQRRLLHDKRKPIQKVVLQEEIEDDFDETKYFSAKPLKKK